MNQHDLHALLSRILLATTSLTMGACGGMAQDSSDDDSTSGGSTGSGGAESGGTGGIVSTGGVVGTGGAIGTGGIVGAGGAIGTGGVTGTGGWVAVDCVGPVAPPVCGGYSVLADASCITESAPTTEQCQKLCTQVVGFGGCSVYEHLGAQVTVMCPPTCAVGRRPAGLAFAEMRSNDLGDYFARVAYLEAASVRAFRELRAELHAQRAPRSLLRALSRAARDETRHARATGALARRFGGRVESQVRAQTAPRSLEALATENATEGCVRETYGALTAHHQASAAQDHVVRAELRRIARDETRHAALSWRMQRWLLARLEPSARERVQEAQKAAIAGLRHELSGAPSREVIEQGGVPAPAQAMALFEGLERGLWS